MMISASAFTVVCLLLFYTVSANTAASPSDTTSSNDDATTSTPSSQVRPSAVHNETDVELFIERLKKEMASQPHRHGDLVGTFGKDVHTTQSSSTTSANNDATSATPPEEHNSDVELFIERLKKEMASQQHHHSDLVGTFGPDRQHISDNDITSTTPSSESKPSDENKHEIELFIERLKKEMAFQQHRLDDLVGTFGSNGRQISNNARSTHKEEKSTKSQAASEWGHELSIDEPVRIVHQAKPSTPSTNDDTTSTTPSSETKPAQHKTEIELFIERLKKEGVTHTYNNQKDNNRDNTEKVASQWGRGLSLDDPVKIVQQAKASHQGSNAHAVPQWSHELSIDEPVRVNHKDQTANHDAKQKSSEGWSHELSINEPVRISHKTQKQASSGGDMPKAAPQVPRGLSGDVADQVQHGGHQDTDKQTVSEQDDGDLLDLTRKQQETEPLAQKLVQSSTEAEDVSEEPAHDDGMFGEYGPTVMIVMGSCAAALLLILVFVVLFVLYYCSAEARGRRKQKKLMTLNKDVNRWDPQVLRPSKENIDAFVFGSPMPSVSEMLSKY